MSQSRIIVSLFWIGLGIFVMIFSYKLGLGRLNNPDSGLMSFLLGLILVLLSLYSLVLSLLKKAGEEEPRKEGRSQANYGKIALVLVALITYSFVLEKLGFVITTWIFLFLLFRGMGNKWITTLIASAFTVLATYFVFTFFGVRFPPGIFR
ncbi:MAG: Tripartite tricarboxylate transporter TctB family [Deltaproteobacteria bacterium]|jgi:putative tricarboxylic transport membrane protein|nr:Tripartite tricarboxylate transporter TctB family [Deltaproteobacteria bacterium]